MSKVQKTVSRWVQRIVGKKRTETPAQRSPHLVELETQALRQVSGGTTETPNKGW